MKTIVKIAAALLVLAPAACLEVKSEDPPQCKTTADCGTGEICEENVCWGNPPMGPFAALVSPPSERNGDLVLREVLALPITGDGWLDDIRLDDAVTYKGSLQTLCPAPLNCDDRSLGASIIFTRKPVFKGGPGFRKVVTLEPGSGAFDVVLPATREGEPKYIVTVNPDGRDAPGPGSSIAQVVPPLRTELAIPSSSNGNLIVLGGLDLPSISGKVATSTNEPLANYRVVALGRWDPKEPVTEVSTVDFTGSTGDYKITLTKELVGTVEIVARPFGAQLRPEIHLGSVPASGGTGKQLLLPAPGFGAERPVEIVVDHQEASGAVTRVAGARVTISGSAPSGTNATTRLTVEGTTDENGSVRLKLLEMQQLVQNYKLSITPPASSQAAALFEKLFSLQPQTSQRLGTRLALIGKVVGADEQPLKDVVVTARPSVRFLWNLEPGPQAFLGAIPAATTTTPNTGEFVVFVDHSFDNVIAGQAGTVWGHYDLTFEPAKATAPSWTRADIELPRDVTTDSLPVGIVQLPDAAHVRGFVFDGEGARLEDAEVKLYRVQTDLAVCSVTRFEPQDCPIPAQLVGRGASDKDGVVRLTLPR